MTVQVHGVVQEAEDFDRPLVRAVIEQRVARGADDAVTASRPFAAVRQMEGPHAGTQFGAVRLPGRIGSVATSRMAALIRAS